MNLTRWRFDWFLVVSLFLSAAAYSQGTYTRLTDIQYVPNGSTTQRLDLYVPDGANSPTPLIVWIHGGGWTSGDKSLGQSAFQLRYAQNGYAMASLNYRLSGEATFPAQIHDCKTAIRWLRANAALYNIDPTRIGVWGSSAGGHLASLLGTSNDVVDLEGTLGSELQFSSRVQAVVDWYGPTDFLQMDSQAIAQGCGGSNHNSATSPESMLVGCQIQTCPTAVQRANPMTYATTDDPPFLIQHGTVDCTVPTGQSQIFRSLLQALSLDHSIDLITGAGHGGPQFSAAANLAIVDSFFETRLRQSVNPMINSVKIYRKTNEIGHFRAGSIGSHHRIVIAGSNIAIDSEVLLNGIRRRGSLEANGELVVRGPVGRIAPNGEVSIQVKSASGRYSNTARVPIIAD
ncbi:MAG: alpha/beta hydrolase [Acidobacteria bacterium]|nr:alpha/beta hydrolase [Acidobacteriota bacterium]